jgi:trimethyllysine dioxygenase
LSKYAFYNNYTDLNPTIAPVYWNKKTLAKRGGLDSYNVNDYLNDDSVLREVLISLKKYGAAIVHGVEAKESEMTRVSKRIGPVQNSHFGEGNVVVQNTLEFVDRAYTNLALKAHTDTAFLKNNAGLEIFHMLKKPKQGGESLLVDGLYCAQQLKEKHKDDFDFLTQTKIESQFYKKGVYNLRYFDQIIKLDPFTNELQQIRLLFEIIAYSL